MSDYKTLSLNTTDIDYLSIRENLKNYLKAQDEFKDYNFDGSAISAIIDMLSYVTHYNAINANIGINESFLNSAKFRGSVVGHARLLGYIPQSVKAPIAYVNVTVFIPTAELITIPKGYAFEAAANGTTYTFVTDQEYESETGVFESIKLLEGSNQISDYVYEKDSAEKYLIRDQNVDISTLSVEVYDSEYTMESKTVFHPAKKLSSIGPESDVYFLHETGEGVFEVQFGDGVLGRALEAGNIIHLSYLVTNVAKANGAGTFAPLEPIQGYENIAVDTIQRAAGGMSREQEESIKFKSPITFAAQNRAVTYRDYEGLIYDQCANADIVRAWGGEELETPVYGKVFISVKPKSALYLTSYEREKILNEILKPKMVTTITPELINPEYLYLTHRTNFTYNPETTTLNSVQLKNKVSEAIDEYAEKRLNKFDSVFRHSVFLAVVDESDPAILNSSSNIFVSKRFIPTLNQPLYYELNYGFSIATNGNIANVISRSTRFSIGNVTNCRLKDRWVANGERVIDIVRGSESVEELVEANVGHITERKIILYAFAPSLVNGAYMNIEVVPETKDITTKENNILMIDKDNSTIIPGIE